MKGFCVLIKKEEQGEGEKSDSLYIRPIESGFFDSLEKNPMLAHSHFFFQNPVLECGKNSRGENL